MNSNKKSDAQSKHTLVPPPIPSTPTDAFDAGYVSCLKEIEQKYKDTVNLVIPGHEVTTPIEPHVTKQDPEVAYNRGYVCCLRDKTIYLLNLEERFKDQFDKRSFKERQESIIQRGLDDAFARGNESLS